MKSTTTARTRVSTNASTRISTSKTPKKMEKTISNRSQSQETKTSIKNALPNWVPEYLKLAFKSHFLDTPPSPCIPTTSEYYIPPLETRSSLCSNFSNKLQNEEQILNKMLMDIAENKKRIEMEEEKVIRHFTSNKRKKRTKKRVSSSVSSEDSDTDSDEEIPVEENLTIEQIKEKASQIFNIISSLEKDKENSSVLKNEYMLEKRLLKILKLKQERTYFDVKKILGFDEFCEDESKCDCFRTVIENVKIY